MSAVLDITHDKLPNPPTAAAPPSQPAVNDNGKSVVPRGGLRTDSLAESVVVLLTLTAVQRFIGFVRGVLVCRWLSPQDLGQWDMAFGFLTLGAPLAVLGLPGSFGRYVEYFRQRGQLNRLLKRTAIVCTALTAAVVSAICIARPWISTIVFGRSDEKQLVLALAICLAIVIAFNYLTELLTALRMARVTAVVQFFNSIMFAGFGIFLLFSWRTQAVSLVAAYGIACALQVAWMIWFLRRQWRLAPPESATIVDADSGKFWSKLLSFAAWVWVGNLMYNLFDVVDRYLIIHTSTVADPLALVGSYHSSRIVPLLLVTIAGLLGTMILPHLSHDWELGHRQQVSARMNLILKLIGLLLFVGSIAILLAGPFMFNVAFNGKYAAGREVLPWTLTFSVWFGLISIAQLYLWCAERARLSCLALGIGLLANIVINLILIPHFGLHGAVWARAASNLLTLALIYRFSAWLGMKIERSLLIVSLLPLALSFGPWVAIFTLIAVIGAVGATNQILSQAEKQRLLVVWNEYISRMRAFWKSNSANKFGPRLAAADDSLTLATRVDAYTPADSGYSLGNSDVSHREVESPPPRPLRVTFYSTSLHVGGAETLLFNLIQRLDRSRFAPELCCLKELGELGEKLSREIPVYADLLRHKFDVRVLRRLTRLLRERQIDAVVTVGAGDKMFWGRLAARRAGVPVIVSALHSTGWPDGITWLNRRLTLLTDAFVAVAKNHAQHLIEREHLPADRVCPIPNGVDTSIFYPRSPEADLRKQLKIPAAAPVVGIVAVLRPEKNHELFLRVAAGVRQQLPEAHFLIIGDGPRRAELESLAEKLGLGNHAHFLGKRADVPQLLNLLDVFVLTSHNEANPVSILEALATAKPVVATKVGSVPETVIDGVTGFLVPPGGELTMTDRLTELLLDPAKAQRLGAAGRRHVVENWSLDRMVDGYEELLERLYWQKRDAVSDGNWR
ncbi:MAG TPA: glycosyltransferase [Pirellulales bacterium]|nr:glycosyltransferase [Pirellulales bacterium]